MESKNQELLAEVDRLKKETEELRLRRGSVVAEVTWCSPGLSAVQGLPGFQPFDGFKLAAVLFARCL